MSTNRLPSLILSAGLSLVALGCGGVVDPGAAVPQPGPPSGDPSSVPSHPIDMKCQPCTLSAGSTYYHLYVPDAYDRSHKTPATLLVWMHGCGGESLGDLWTVSAVEGQSWISLSLGGAEGGCWDVTSDPARVLAAVADVKTHLNIKPHGVVLGGYSSGGDLTYRTAFEHASLFAGVIVENSSPFRDTGASRDKLLGEASWKFNVAHLAHLQDGVYPIGALQADGTYPAGTVRHEIGVLGDHGYPATLIERDGGHWDDAGARENGHPVPGTLADRTDLLLPYLNAGWLAP